jgi:hypothetical protein
MHCIQISARIIRWPQACACCCQASDTAVEVRSTRTTGKRVIRTHTKSWSVPYCSRCREHIQVGTTLRAFSMAVIHLSFVFGVLALVMTGLVYMLVSRLPMTPAVLLTLATLVMGTTLVIASYPWFQQKYEADVGRKKSECEKLEKRLASLLSPTCCAHDTLAVAYGGWQGTVHSFFFSSQQYAEALEKANPGKCWGSG